MTEPRAAVRLFAWGGAALFFLALAYFLFTYVTRFGVAAPDGDSAPAITWNVILFTLFAAHHSVFARERVRRWVAQIVSAGLERSFYVWIASLLFIAVCAWWRPVPGIAWRADGGVLWSLRLLQVAGVWLSLHSAAILDIRELAGLTFQRPEGLRLPGDADGDMVAGSLQASGIGGLQGRGESVAGGLQGPKELVAGGFQASGLEFKARGPYGWIRHPIYSGWFLLVFAASPMTMTRLVFAIVSCAYLLMAIPFEERSLRAGSAGAYERYMRQVRWKLVPGVFGWWMVGSGWW